MTPDRLASITWNLKNCVPINQEMADELIAACRDLMRERDEWEHAWRVEQKVADKPGNELLLANLENVRLRKALEWYADASPYEYEDDLGERASAALAEP